jgi:hypothetical protein
MRTESSGHDPVDALWVVPIIILLFAFMIHLI